MKKLLISVDMLNDFCHESGTLSKSIISGEFYAKSIIDFVKTKVEEYRTNTDPILWLADNHTKDDLEFNRFPPHAVAGTWGAGVINELRPLEIENSVFEEMIYKTRYSGFYNTALDMLLDKYKPELVEVVGVCTSICVMDTVGGLANRDYSINVFKDGVADFSPDGHTMALARMAGLYGAEIV